ncbi:MAG: HPr family phosphocarrier protein [Oscillospiraceae bacterium]
MVSVLISLSSPDIVKSFVSEVTKLDGDFDLISDRYILDARSLMGIFSLDLTKPIELRILNDTQQNIDALKSFMIEEPRKLAPQDVTAGVAGNA